MSQDGFVSTVLAQAGIATKGIVVTRCRINGADGTILEPLLRDP